jgi:iron complex transport system substrate-binding protein
MAAANWMPELVEMAGAENVAWSTWEDLAAADPEVILVMPCGFDRERAVREMHWLTDRPDWRVMQAVRNQRVYVADGNQYFNRPGPRLVESLEILARILHPEIFPNVRSDMERSYSHFPSTEKASSTLPGISPNIP